MPAYREAVCFVASQALGLSGPAPDRCTPEVMHAIVEQHMESPAMWAIFPLQVYLASPLQVHPERVVYHSEVLQNLAAVFSMADAQPSQFTGIWKWC